VVQAVHAANVYRGVTDVDYLRAVIDGLSGLVEEVDADLGRVSSVGPGVDRARLVRGMAVRRRRWALERVTELIVDAAQRCPVVLDPHDRPVALSVQGQPLTPLVTAGAADTWGLSSAQVWMPPGHVSHAHVHRHTDVGVVVLQGRAVTMWWDERGGVHELVQEPGQHLHIPFGVAHAAVNPSGQPVVAVEWRSNRMFTADNERLPELDAVVRARLAGPKAVA